MLQSYSKYEIAQFAPPKGEAAQWRFTDLVFPGGPEVEMRFPPRPPSASSSRRTRSRLAVGPLLIGALALPSCGVSGLSFVTDNRVRIVAPTENATVALPLRLTWSARDYGGSFVVLFDRSPMRPNQTLRSLVPEDDPCRTQVDCPDAQWLSERNVYVTDETRLVVENLPDLRGDNDRAKDRHDVTIVLLDEEGQRMGESAFTREFIVERDR